MSSQFKMSSYSCLWLLAAALMTTCLSPVIAEDSPPEVTNAEKLAVGKTIAGIEIGALVLLGLDFRMFLRKVDSPWVYGVRYLDIEDDFINESAAGLPSDGSDREYSRRSGIYFNYLFNHLDDNSFYLGGALYNTMNKIECDIESDSDSSTSIYFGGGYQGHWKNGFGYKIGMLLSPFVNLNINTSNCSSESDGDIDVNASLTFVFN